MGVHPGSREAAPASQQRPATRGIAATVKVHIGGRDLGTAEPTAEFRDYAFPIPEALAAELAQRNGPSEIRIQSSTWAPSESLRGKR